MKLGDAIKSILRPFVAGTKLEHCSGCERRRIALNRASDWVSRVIAIITCPCFYKSMARKIFRRE